nr:hypothetical protein [uncultured Bacteroides sp.]
MFDKLILVDDLLNFLQENADFLFELSDATYEQLKEEKDDLEKFILLCPDKIQSLDFSDSINRAFLFFLFDLCERLQLSSCLEQIYVLLLKNSVYIGCRLQAAVLFNIQISENGSYLSVFDEVCKLLENALANEEDDDRKMLATFSNYYLTVLNRNNIWIVKLKSKIRLAKDTYPFLSSDFVIKLLSFDTSKIEECISNIQSLKDSLFGRRRIEIAKAVGNLLIEDSDYANSIKQIEDLSFSKLRKVALDLSLGSIQLDGRGVKPLTTDNEMLVYLRNYGNMHYAKMMSAIELLPLKELGENVEIIDWGCGQALAAMIFFEYCNDKKLNIRPKVTLIEPSELAIRRALLHVKMFSPEAIVKTVCKYMDDLVVDDVLTDSNCVKIHLFSNILDVESYSITKLESLITNTQKGQNYFLCASPYINDFKTNRIDSFKRYFEVDGTFCLYGELENGKLDDDYWLCNEQFKGLICNIHTNYGCYKKWTRVIRTFSVQL